MKTIEEIRSAFAVVRASHIQVPPSEYAAARDAVLDAIRELETLRAASALLREVFDAIEFAADEKGGVIELGCGNCDAACPMEHSLGCKVRNLLAKVER